MEMLCNKMNLKVLTDRCWEEEGEVLMHRVW